MDRLWYFFTHGLTQIHVQLRPCYLVCETLVQCVVNLAITLFTDLMSVWAREL